MFFFCLQSPRIPLNLAVIQPFRDGGQFNEHNLISKDWFNETAYVSSVSPRWCETKSASINLTLYQWNINHINYIIQIRMFTSVNIVANGVRIQNFARNLYSAETADKAKTNASCWDRPLLPVWPMCYGDCGLNRSYFSFFFSSFFFEVLQSSPLSPLVEINVDVYRLWSFNSSCSSSE